MKNIFKVLLFFIFIYSFFSPDIFALSYRLSYPIGKLDIDSIKSKKDLMNLLKKDDLSFIFDRIKEIKKYSKIDLNNDGNLDILFEDSNQVLAFVSDDIKNYKLLEVTPESTNMGCLSSSQNNQLLNIYKQNNQVILEIIKERKNKYKLVYKEDSFIEYNEKSENHKINSIAICLWQYYGGYPYQMRNMYVVINPSQIATFIDYTNNRKFTSKIDKSYYEKISNLLNYSNFKDYENKNLKIKSISTIDKNNSYLDDKQPLIEVNYDDNKICYILKFGNFTFDRIYNLAWDIKSNNKWKLENFNTFKDFDWQESKVLNFINENYLNSDKISDKEKLEIIFKKNFNKSVDSILEIKNDDNYFEKLKLIPIDLNNDYQKDLIIQTDKSLFILLSKIKYDKTYEISYDIKKITLNENKKVKLSNIYEAKTKYTYDKSIVLEIIEEEGNSKNIRELSLLKNKLLEYNEKIDEDKLIKEVEFTIKTLSNKKTNNYVINIKELSDKNEMIPFQKEYIDLIREIYSLNWNTLKDEYNSDCTDCSEAILKITYYDNKDKKTKVKTIKDKGLKGSFSLINIYELFDQLHNAEKPKELAKKENSFIKIENVYN